MPAAPRPPFPVRRHALIPCAGTGSRSGASIPKQYVELAGRSLLGHTLAALAGVPRLDSLWLVLSPDDTGFDGAVPAGSRPRHLQAVRCGGETRAETVTRGLEAMQAAGVAPDDWVLVHDAARCLLQPAWVDRLIDACQDHPVGGLLALPLADTLKQAGPSNAPAHPGGPATAPVEATLDRSRKWLAQTPQMFRLGMLLDALRRCGSAVTDEASALEACGLQPLLVESPMENFKLTWPTDFALAERLLTGRGPSTP